MALLVYQMKGCLVSNATHHVLLQHQATVPNIDAEKGIATEQIQGNDTVTAQNAAPSYIVAHGTQLPYTA